MSVLSRDPIEFAAELGLAPVTPQRNELLLDIDDAASENRLDAALACFQLNGETIEIVRRTISNGGNRHVYLRLPDWREIDPVMRVALQACCGSDPIRELLSLFRIVRGYDIPPTVLFERTDEVDTWKTEASK